MALCRPAQRFWYWHLNGILEGEQYYHVRLHQRVISISSELGEVSSRVVAMFQVHIGRNFERYGTGGQGWRAGLTEAEKKGKGF